MPSRTPSSRPAPSALATRLLAGVALAIGAVSAPPLGAAGDDPALAAVRKRLEEPDPATRAAAVRRLAGALDEASVRLVVGVLSDPHPYVRRAAAGVLGVVVDTGVRGRLLKDAPAWKDAVARAEATRSFATWADRDGRTGLLRALGDRDPRVRAAAARWLGEDPDEVAGRALVVSATDPDALVRATSLDALVARQALRGASKVELPLAAGNRDRDPRVRLSALEGSVAAGGDAAVFAAIHGLDDAVWSVRLVAAELSGTVRDRRMIVPLVEALRDGRDRVAQAAATSLLQLTGIPFGADPARWRVWLQGDGATFDPSTVPARKPTPFDAGGQTVAAVRFLDLPVASGHVAFVLDASGSMAEKDAAGTSRWDRVRAEVDRVLETLGTSAEGNVILFSDAATPLFREAVRFAPAAREKVRTALAAHPPAGRTALYDGIEKALEDPAVDTVVLLSDGAPSAGAFFTKTDLRAEVRRANRWRRARIDVVAIGADEVAKRWRSLLREIADDAGGRFLAK